MAGFLDVCRFTPTAGGLTDWTVSAAVTGYQTPASANAVNGTVYRYRAESADLTQWEVGFGTYAVAGTVLARTTILFSSAANAKVNFSTVPQVAVVLLAEDLGPNTGSKFTNSLSSPVSLNNTANFFDGPSVAQGTSGTWFASGTVSMQDTAGAASFACELWDGSTVIASSASYVPIASTIISISLSGILTNPTGNIRMSCRDFSSTSGQITAIAGGIANASTLSVFRIA